jgi:uncharacterized protein
MKWCVVALFMMFVSCASIPSTSQTWQDERWGGVKQQTLDNSCGLGSLLTVMHHHYGDSRFDERALLAKYIEHSSEDELLVAMRKGMSMLELEYLGRSVGYKTIRHMFTLDELERMVSVVPVIVYLEIGELRHFAVVRGVNKESVWLADSSRGNVYHSREQFLEEWRTPESLRDQWSRPGGLIIMRKGGKFALNLLKEPQSAIPPAFRELRRQMFFN